MPELPEVQTIVNDLNAAGVTGLAVTGARVYWPRTVAEPSAAAFCSRIRNKVLTSVWRRGKYIVLDFSGPVFLLIHLRMSGRLVLTAPEAPRSKHEHAVLTLADRREIRLHDTRKFGRLRLTEDPSPVLDRLGPEPLDAAFSAKVLADILLVRKRRLKPLLLDQNTIAGLGNIYTDEALWHAGLHPCRTAASLSMSDVRALHRAIRKVLRRGLENQGTSLGSGKNNFASISRIAGRNRYHLKVFRRTGLPCPRCKTPIQRLIVAQRSTHVCPACQVIENRI